VLEYEEMVVMGGLGLPLESLLFSNDSIKKKFTIRVPEELFFYSLNNWSILILSVTNGTYLRKISCFFVIETKVRHK